MSTQFQFILEEINSRKKLMKKKSLLIIGGTGFFGKSILDYFANYINLKKKIQKILIISRKNCRLDILDIIKKNYEFKKINEDMYELSIRTWRIIYTVHEHDKSMIITMLSIS